VDNPGKRFGYLALLLAVACSSHGTQEQEALARKQSAILLAGFEIRLPAGIYPSQVVFGANESLNIADDVRLLEPDQTTRSLAVNAGALSTEVGVQSQMKDLLSVANVFLRDSSHIFCSVDTAGALTQQNQVVIDGALEQGVDLGVRTAASWTVTFPPPQRDVRLEPDQSASLAPGSYGVLSAKSRSVVTLTRPGTYYFQSFFIEPQARFVVSNSGGPVYVFVSGGSFTWRGLMQKQNTSVHNVLFGYLGTSDAVVDATFIGTIVAPNAKMNLISTSQGYTGSFFARSIDTAQPHVTYVHQPFNPGDCGANASACAIGLGCADLNGNDKPDCRECPTGVPPVEPAPPPFTWSTSDPTAPHVVGIGADGNRLNLTALIGHDFIAPVQFPPRVEPTLIASLADLDDSSFADVAFLEGECTSLKWIRRVNSALALYDLANPLLVSTDSALRAGRFMSGGDLDGDGFDDLLLTTTQRGVLSAFEHQVFTNNGNGTQFVRSATQTDYTNTTVVDQSLGDFDEDGFPDLVLSVRRNSACGDTIELFPNSHQAGTPFGAHASSSLDLLTLMQRHSRTDALTAGDFNGDCKSDLMVLSGGDLFFLGGRGDFTFDAPVFVRHLSGLGADVDLDHIDVDSDGHQDLLVASGRTLRWFRGDGTGSVSDVVSTIAWGRRVSVWQRGCVL